MIADVADSSVAEDRRKGSVYAAANIPVYWIINLVDRQVEVFSQPVDGAYQHDMIHRFGEFVPVVIDGKPLGQIPLMDLLP